MNEIISQRGRFIAFEGPDGAGKSTIAELLMRELEQQGIPALYLKSPGGTELSDVIRAKVLVQPDLTTSVRLHSMLLAMLSTTIERVVPALLGGVWVVMDRYLLSTLVYQGLLAGYSVDAVHRAINTVFESVQVRPDAYAVLMVPPEVTVQRIDARGKDRTVFETDDMLRRMHAAYSFSKALVKEPVFMIDADGEISKVWSRTRHALSSILPYEDH